MTERITTSTPPPTLRAAIARDLVPVSPLHSPLMRMTTLVPLALLLLVAAPLTFHLRTDLARLGWTVGWGLSIAETMLGLGLIAAAMREAIPGRTWSPAGVSAWLALVLVAFVLVTLAAWSASPVHLREAWWGVGALCLMGSAASALPAVALGSILAARAWPTRPAIAGALVGLGAGLLSDAGWRLFCHFSEPSHVLAAHLGGIIASAVIGAGLTRWLRN